MLGAMVGVPTNRLSRNGTNQQADESADQQEGFRNCEHWGKKPGFV